MRLPRRAPIARAEVEAGAFVGDPVEVLYDALKFSMARRRGGRATRPPARRQGVGSERPRLALLFHSNRQDATGGDQSARDYDEGATGRRERDATVMALTTSQAAMVRVVIAAVALSIGVLPWRVAVLPAITADAPAPAAVERLLPDAKNYLAGQLDLVAAHVRFIVAELRERDDLVILKFELRPFPYLSAEGAYLVSRCTPVEQLDAVGMGGGRGVADFATDPELEHARSGAQPPCGED